VPGLEALPQAPPSARPNSMQPPPPPAQQQLDLGRVTMNAAQNATPGAPAFSAAATAQVSAVDADADAQRLQTAGRISLAVDFPTEGQLFHFKKVKANARLGLTVVSPESFARWQYLAVALALAGILAWLSRLADRRRTAPKLV